MSRWLATPGPRRHCIDSHLLNHPVAKKVTSAVDALGSLSNLRLLGETEPCVNVDEKLTAKSYDHITSFAAAAAAMCSVSCSPPQTRSVLAMPKSVNEILLRLNRGLERPRVAGRSA